MALGIDPQLRASGQAPVKRSASHGKGELLSVDSKQWFSCAFRKHEKSFAAAVTES